MKSYFPALLIFVTIFVTGMRQTAAQPPAAQPAVQDAERISKVKKDLLDIGVGNEVTVSRLDNRDFFGRVRTIGTADFQIIETDSKRIQIFKYEDIKNVRSGDGNKNPVTGKRRNSRVGRIIGFVAAGTAAVLAIVIIKALKDPNF